MVNGENNGAECFFNSSSFEMCPIEFDNWDGLPTKNEHLNNFTCRYLSFLDTKIAKPVYFSNETIGKKYSLKMKFFAFMSHWLSQSTMTL